MPDQMCQHADNNHQQLGQRIRNEIEAQYRKTRHDQDAFMKRFKEAENRVEEAGKMPKRSTKQKWRC
jgi:hypothetical protein